MMNDSDILQVQFGQQSHFKIHLHGATLIDWQVNNHPLLFLSSMAKLDGSRAIRGGIPLVFPIFGPSASTLSTIKFHLLPTQPNLKEMAQHGLARTSKWTLSQHVNTLHHIGLELALHSSHQTRDYFPFDFQLIYQVLIHKSQPNTLTTRLGIKYTSSPLSHQQAIPPDFMPCQVLFHTYFRTSSLPETRVTGLSGPSKHCRIRLNADPAHPIDHSEPETGESITQETDQVHIHTLPHPIHIHTPSHTITVTTTQNLEDVVFWNPGRDKALALYKEGKGDFDKHEYEQMLCVEVGNIERGMEIQRGGDFVWIGQTLSVDFHNESSSSL